MTEMVETVARAICLAGHLPDDVRKDCETLCSLCLDEARAAIEAHEAALKDKGLVIVPREPTPEM